eukprot:12264659-Alexandrium_andersonii.AAC.1
MSASLVGSEMCIRDRTFASEILAGGEEGILCAGARSAPFAPRAGFGSEGCLLYTSDAADDM